LAVLGFDITNGINWIPVVTAILPIAVGGGLVKCLKDWTYSEKEMKEKVKQAKSTITEKMAQKHVDLLDAQTAGKPLRGSPPQTTDYVGNYSTEVTRCFGLLLSVEVVKVETVTAYWALMISMLAGVLILILGILAASLNWGGFCFYLIATAVLLVLLQCAIVIRLRSLTRNLDHDCDSI
jgi:hypothetical protein